MKKLNLSILIILVFVLSASAQNQPNYLWGKSVGNTDITTDSNGDVFTISSFTDTVLVNNTSYIDRNNGILLSKLSNTGNMQWVKQFSTDSAEVALSICIDQSDNIYISGYYSGRTIFGKDTLRAKWWGMFLLKLNNKGDIIWAKSIADPVNSTIYNTNNICTDKYGYIYASVPLEARQGDTLYIGKHQYICKGENDIAIIKYNRNGDVVWVNHEGSKWSDIPLGIATDNTGNVYSTGTFSDTAYFRNTQVIASNSFSNIYLAKYDSSGKLEFITLGDIEPLAHGSFVGTDIAIGNDGSIYITGTAYDNIIHLGNVSINSLNIQSSFIAKYNTLGKIIWGKESATNVEGIKLTLDNNDNIYVASFTDTFNPNTSLVKYDSAGTILWSNTNLNTRQPAIFGLCTGNNGELYITGTYDEHNNIFGSDTLSSVQTPTPLRYFANSFIARIGLFPTTIQNIIFDNELVLYPNPNNGTFTLSTKNLFQYSSYNIINTAGQVVQEGEINNNSQKVVEANQLPASVYTLHLYSHDNVKTIRFQKL